MTVPDTHHKHLLWLSLMPRGQFKYQRLREINEACQRASLCILPQQEWNWVEEFHFLQVTAIKFAAVQRNKRRYILRPKLGWACACILRFTWATPCWVSPIWLPANHPNRAKPRWVQPWCFIATHWKSSPQCDHTKICRFCGFFSSCVCPFLV